MRIAEVMTRDVRVIDPERSVRDAARLMDHLNVGSLPVCDGERLVGMITDRDIAVRGVAKGFAPDTPVSELMTKDCITAREDDDVSTIASKMSEAQVRRLPVIDDQERLCGIVSLGDLSRDGDDQSASQALAGVSQPGGQHRQ